MNYFMFGNINSKDYNVFISGENTFVSPERDVDIVAVPGRDGTLSIDNGRFDNVNIEYPCAIVHGFRQNFDAFKGALLSQRGYKRLADSYDVDHFRRARFLSTLDPEMTQLNRHGQFTVNFDCDPRRFLKIGDKAVEFNVNGSLMNPTSYTAKPLIRAYGVGALTIGGNALHVQSADGYTDIDTELQEAYKGATNCNNNIILDSGNFPTLAPGIDAISFTGFTKLEITPRWYTV
jgi:phage-related protein